MTKQRITKSDTELPEEFANAFAAAQADIIAEAEDSGERRYAKELRRQAKDEQAQKRLAKELFAIVL